MLSHPLWSTAVNPMHDIMEIFGLNVEGVRKPQAYAFAELLFLEI